MNSLFNANNKEQVIYLIIVRIAITLLILPIHEFAHAWAARRCGDDTAEASGRLTFNPLSHVDPIGAILLIFTGFGWAKPVPINPNRMNNPRRGTILTSLAGPLSNLIVAFLAFIILRVISGIPIHSATLYSTLNIIAMMLSMFVSINIGLAIFNLIPIPPLDGSKILMGFLPYRAIAVITQYERAISFVFMILILSGSGILNIPLGFLNNLVYKFFVFSTGWIDIIMNAITG